MNLAELTVQIQQLGEPTFRARQLHQWLYVHCVRDFQAMTNMARPLRDKLAEHFTIGSLTIADKQVSVDGTIKYLFRLADGKVVESVLIYFPERDAYSICLSTQVGCAVDCAFCATGKLGFMRNLSVGEIVEQYLYVQHDSGKDVKNIVFMGQGEPLLNYDNLIPAIHLLNQSAEVGMRHITVSTSGIVPKIAKLAEEDLQLTLAISLHAPTDDVRERIMPLNRKWPIADVMNALLAYEHTTGRRITVEYVMLAGVNDSAEQAHQLGRLLKPLKCHVNLIPYNPIDDQDTFSRPKTMQMLIFRDIVDSYGKKTTLRMERGVDIAAACGQLANKATNR